MKWHLTVAAGLLGASAVLGAQAPGQQPADKPSSQPTTEQRPAQSSETKENKITMSGCLKPGASPGSFVLADAGMAPAGREAPPVALGTTGSTKTYNIVAKSAEDISKHVNHKIEVTGTLSAARPASAPTPDTAASAAAAPPAGTVTVETFKMVAAACP